MNSASKLAFALLLVAGCGAPADDAASTTSDLASATEPGIDVTGSYHRAYIDTPTYGYEPTAPFLTIEVTVDDAKIRAAHPGFDGFEHAFALVPNVGRIELPFTGSRTTGYIQLRQIDVHGVTGVHVSEEAYTASSAQGIAIGLETNVGTLWAQAPGHDFPVR